MKLSVIHNLYKQNKYVLETVRLNLIALDTAKADYEYILFNDHGDTKIKDDVSETLSHPNVKYIYSDVNYGKGKCSGGWVGAIPYLNGDFIHNTGQDDVFTATFYKKCLEELHSDDNLMLVFANSIVTTETLKPVSLMLNMEGTPDYGNPDTIFNWWFGVGEGGATGVTRANNNIPAPGVIYRKTLHKLIGIPDLDTFFGAADFEYWARVIFYRNKCKFIKEPLWLYRKSEFSTSIENDVSDTQVWVDKVKEKYSKLYSERIK